MNNYGGAIFLVGLIMGMLLGVFLTECVHRDWKNTAIKLGHAQYAVYENGKTEFCWKERGDR